ncbi:MAG TPA: sortase [Candidatus Saccharimonadales bacterium]|nr:sortase [Candidatus Saccharimonadales bacterium]
MTKKWLLLNLFGLCSLLAGIVLFLSIVRERAVNIVSAPSQPTTAMRAAQPKAPNYISGEPNHLSIPSLGINLDVIPGYYNATSQKWTLTLDKVQFAAMTTPPNNQSGVTFMYGHARTNVFGSLPKIQPGAQAIVTTANGHTFYYTLDHNEVVAPTDSNSVFSYSGKPILTLQTCVGLFFQKRDLITFRLDKAV